jgi:hypothetical protein
MNGIELENTIPNSPCEFVGSHLKMRLFVNEMLNSVDLSGMVIQKFSSLVLAVLDDSG